MLPLLMVKDQSKQFPELWSNLVNGERNSSVSAIFCSQTRKSTSVKLLRIPRFLCPSMCPVKIEFFRPRPKSNDVNFTLVNALQQTCNSPATRSNQKQPPVLHMREKSFQSELYEPIGIGERRCDVR